MFSLQTDSDHKQRDRKVRYDDWNGASAHERYEVLASIDKYVDLASQKMSEFGESVCIDVRICITFFMCVHTQSVL